MVEPIFAGDSTTVTPASLSALILSWAVPFPPATIAAHSSQEKDQTEISTCNTCAKPDKKTALVDISMCKVCVANQGLIRHTILAPGLVQDSEFLK
jgi:hypothetical protein